MGATHRARRQTGTWWEIKAFVCKRKRVATIWKLHQRCWKEACRNVLNVIGLTQTFLSFRKPLKKLGLKQEFVTEFQVDCFTVNILHWSWFTFLPPFMITLSHVLSFLKKPFLYTALLSFNLPLKDLKLLKKNHQGILHPAETGMENKCNLTECNWPAIDFGVMKLML